MINPLKFCGIQLVSTLDITELPNRVGKLRLYAFELIGNGSKFGVVINQIVQAMLYPAQRYGYRRVLSLIQLLNSGPSSLSELSCVR